ncbi:type I pullulanase [Rufibacter sp. LB8]|uniref:type I pullulanase n=1 Tax=Rufibacter sp. LB8 TaxID=2777781 RepID=UPI00178C67DD|nr:type I pullulanase [Rufibacter sp. LB8]
MRFILLFLLLIFWGKISVNAQMPAPDYTSYPTAPDANLWLTYTPSATTFRLWSPVAQAVTVKLFDRGTGGKARQLIPMRKGRNGLWELTVRRNLNGTFYTYKVKVNGKWLEDTPGIYATAVGVNGERAMVLDLAATNPEGWATDKGPTVKTMNDVVLWEAHVRDITSHPSSGSSFPGKFLGLVEPNTKNKAGQATGLDHIKALGITHIHLLPSFDFVSVNEAKPDSAQFNWGYDPQNYNVPEGSYATDATKPEVRIKEFKQMVKGFHDQGIGVVMDVVYNHTGRTENSNFNLETPGYYYRHTPEGKYSDGAACGNETASERTMMRKFMVESCKFWAREYHIDGFRFDLMALHDLETMNLLAAELKKINPSIILYGEGWTASQSPLPDTAKSLKTNTHQLQHIATFSDDLRDAIKGSVFDDKNAGFVNGAENTEEALKFGIVGSIPHPQVNLTKLGTNAAFWTREPWQAVSYTSCHDNLTLFDKLKVSVPEASPEELKKMHLLANAIVLTSQGTAFLHAGDELLRTKKGAHNSYNLPDSVNQLNWDWKTQHPEVYSYYQSLIELRKTHPAFHLSTADMVRQHLEFVKVENGFLGFRLKNHANGDAWQEILVYYNARDRAVNLSVQGEWNVAAEGNFIDPDGLRTVRGSIAVPPVSMLILFQK